MNLYNSSEAREVYWEGFHAYLAGYSLNSNPYTDEAQYEQWKNGWYDAADDD